MEDLKVKRVRAKLIDMYKPFIDMSDWDESKMGDSTNALSSRALAAYALVTKTGIEISESAKYITDGFNDGGIDLIYKDEFSHKLFFVQAKFVNDGKGSISQGDTASFCSGIEKIISLDINDFNQKIKKLETMFNSAIEDMNYRLEMIVTYTSDNPLPKDAEKEIKKLCKRINDDANELIHYSVINLKDIYTYLSSNSSNQIINLDNVEIQNWGPFEESETSIRGYYGQISATIVGSWWEKYKANLLSKNIRYFKGDTDVNNGIKRVLTKEPDNFIYYNNGIKILAKKVTRTLKTSNTRQIGVFNIESASIVNGAQTVGSIGELYINGTDLSKANVFVQIISLESKSENFGIEITRLSNTQNRIENKDFIGINDSFHEKLRQDFALDEIDYIYKTGNVITNFSKKCTAEEAVIAHGCYVSDIDVSTAIKKGIGSIYEDLTKTPYKLIFNPSVSNYLIWNCIQITNNFESRNKNYQNNANGINRLISIHGNRFLLHLFFQKIKMDNKYSNIATTYLTFTKEIETEIDAFLNKSIKDISIKINTLYPGSYPANIFKNAKKCRDLKNAL